MRPGDLVRSASSYDVSVFYSGLPSGADATKSLKGPRVGCNKDIGIVVALHRVKGYAVDDDMVTVVVTGRIAFAWQVCLSVEHATR